MYKLLIVDDEYHTREGLKQLLNWKGLGIEIEGVCCDGKEGVEKALEIKPDIILTDIKMNVMDGLSMADKIKEAIDCEFIIISGYTLFEYAHKAMNTGIAHYLVKPVSRNMLEEAVMKVIAVLNKKKHRNMLENLEDSEYLIDFLINGNENAECREFIPFGKFRVFMFQSESTLTNGREDKIRIFSELSLLLGDLYIYFVNSKAFVLVADLINFSVDTIKNKIDADFKIGVSEESSGDVPFRELYEHATAALQYSVYSSVSGIVEYNDTMENRAGTFFSDALKYILNALESGEVDGAKDEIDDVFLKARKERIMPSEVTEWAKHLFWCVFNIVKPKHENDSDDMVAYKRRLDYCVKDKFRIDDLKSLLKEICETCAIISSHSDEQVNTSVMKEIVDYVDAHFHEDISLQKLSSMFFVEFSYLSKLFKTYTGECYIQYLTRKRIQKAKELLLKPDLTIYEVAFMVSFEDPKYFSNLFKKTEGITPRDYRLKNKVK